MTEKNFKLKMYCGLSEDVPSDAVIVAVDTEEEEVMYLGKIIDYSIAQEIVRRWNEYREE